MNNKIVKTKIKVMDNLINVIRINNTDYISLTDLARYKNSDNPGDVIIKEFASWIDPAFKLYLIKEFERLKYNENYQNKINWSVRRMLTKTNYRIHTDSIKENIIPNLTKKQKKFVYADEADVINVALFGMTAKEWEDSNPDLKGNIRDYTDVLHLVVLSNLEVLNANMIENNIKQSERLVKLNNIAKKELEILITDNNIIGINNMDEKVNNLISTK